MSKYDQSIEISHEEEGTYHRREIDCPRPRSPVTTQYVEKYQVPTSSSVKPKKPSGSRRTGAMDTSDDEDNFEEWTTSKRKVNHKTRQVETRVSRQLLVRGGEVIADSGPQVVTRIKEDNKVEESEKEKTPKNKGRFEALENAPESADSSGLVLGEKKEIQRVSREIREENMQYHDERFKELTGKDVHRRAIRAPHELITINDDRASSKPRGKMIHYSNKGKKYQDTDEILEVAKLAIDGSITKEVKRTNHHEEFSEDEKPDEKGEAEQLRHKPIAERSSRRHVDYVNDFDDVDAPAKGEFVPLEYDSDGGASRGSAPLRRTNNSKHFSQSASRRGHDDEAFPRYEIDPLLNSLRDEDFKPTKTSDSNTNTNTYARRPASGIGRRRDSTSSEDSDHRSYNRSSRQGGRTPSPAGGRVDIPEEYRANKQRLMTGKGGRAAIVPSSHKTSNRSQHRSSSGRKEDVATQARLTDEEVERHSERSSSPSHEKTTRYLQRQSTPNSSRHYYYGDSHRRHQVAAAKAKQRPVSPSSSSSASLSSLDDPKAKQRRQGATSRDSGFKSPHQQHSYGRTDTPDSVGAGKRHKEQQQQIYSVSSKHNKGPGNKYNRDHAISPTPTSGSMGQRSVKTTTTTVSAGLADRPLSRNERSASSDDYKENRTRSKSRDSDKSHDNRSRHKHNYSNDNKNDDESKERQRHREKRRHRSRQQLPVNDDDGQEENQVDELTISVTADPNSTLNQSFQTKLYDTVSVSSLNSPNATKIKVPYRRIIEIEQEQVADQKRRMKEPASLADSRIDHKTSVVKTSSSEMSFQEDIESLSKRLARISRDKETDDGQSGGGDNDRLDSNRQQHYDYKTIIANVHPAAPKHKQIIDAYNVRLIEQNSPFYSRQAGSLKHYDKSNNNETCQPGAATPTTTTIVNIDSHTDNNNVANFSLDDYVKYYATPALVDNQSLQSNCDQTFNDNNNNNNMHDDDDEPVSLISSVSLQSARTYNIRKLDSHQLKSSTNKQLEAVQLPDEGRINVEQNGTNDRAEDEQKENIDQAAELAFDENGNGKPAAWIFDPRDGSSTIIVPPARPEPDVPKVDSRTEELYQARGGRSYYLELIEPSEKAAKRQRPFSNDPLYSRWNSQGALNTASSSYRPLAPASMARNNLPRLAGSTMGQQMKSQHGVGNKKENTASANSGQQPPRRQLPFGGPPSWLGDKSKSSSCLLSVTKPSKYSIYGGFKKPGESNKPVPRLSYSRAIGPRSQRALDNQPKVPSRYMKMR